MAICRPAADHQLTLASGGGSSAGGGSSPGRHGLDAIAGYCSLSTENLGPGMNDHDGTGQDGRPGLNLMACRSSAPRSFQQFGPLDPLGPGPTPAARLARNLGHHMLTFCPPSVIHPFTRW